MSDKAGVKGVAPLYPGHYRTGRETAVSFLFSLSADKSGEAGSKTNWLECYSDYK